jgi:perosamine synthetase
VKFRSWPIVDKEHVDAVEAVAKSGQWHYGRVHEELERDLEIEYNRLAVTTASCAWAIYLAIRAIGSIGTVAVPAYTYYGSVHPIIWAGARPVFVDVDPCTYNMCPDDLKRTLEQEDVDAVLGVHLHGLPFSLDIQTVCREHSRPLIEDVCQAQGATVFGQKVGTLGTASAFSFNNRKTLPAGLGGVVLFENEEDAIRAREIRSYGKRTADGLLSDVGSYLPISEFDAALARIQLRRISGWLNYTNELAQVLGAALSSRAPHVPPEHTHTWHKYRILGRQVHKAALQSRGVLTSTWMNAPLTKYPAYRAFVTRDHYPGAEELCSNTFLLFDDEHPLIAQTKETIEQVATILMEVFQ